MGKRRPVEIDGVTIYPPTPAFDGFRLVWYDPTGERRQGQAQTFDDAVERAKTIGSHISVGTPIRDAERTIADLAANYLSSISGKSKGYQSRQESLLRLWILPTSRQGKRWPGIGKLTMLTWAEAHSEALLDAARAASLSPSRVQDMGGALRALITRAHKLHWMQPMADPMRGVGYYAPSGRDYGEAVIDSDTLPTTVQVEALFKGFEVIDEHRLGMLARLAGGSGLRWAELIGLRPMDVDLQRRVIRVTRSIHEDDHGAMTIGAPKNRRRRETVFPRSIEADLRHLCETVELSSGPDGLLFTQPHRQGEPSYVTARYFYRRWAKAAAFADWPVKKEASAKKHRGQLATYQWSIHDLRHYFACWMLFDVGADVALVSRWLGHHNVAFTYARYVGVRGDHAKQGRDLTEDW